jgi:DNA-directed RNA polymerase subunit RPC12/RpoP
MAKIIQVEIACADCGSRLFAFAKKPPAHDDIAFCAECGEPVGTYEAIRTRAKQACEAHRRS